MSISFLTRVLSVSTASDLLTMSVSAADKIVYLAILLLMRLAGKRLLAQMNNLDLVVVLLLSNVVQNAIIGPDNSVTGGLLGAVVLLVINTVLDRLTQRSPVLQRIFEGTGTQVVKDGRLIEPALARLGTSRRELAGALHQQGADSVEEVDSAVVEPGGGIFIRLKREEQNVSRAELDAAVERITAEIKDAVAADTGSTSNSR